MGSNYDGNVTVALQFHYFFSLVLTQPNDGYDNMNLTNGERLVSGLKNLVNDIYAKDISRKSSEALRIKQRKGEFIGSYAPYGYMKDKGDKNKLLPNPETAYVVELIFKWKADGEGTAKICRKLIAMGIPSPGKYGFNNGISYYSKFRNSMWNDKTVGIILRNPLYLGHMVQGKYNGALYEGVERKLKNREDWIIVENTHEPIVSQELYDAANVVMDERKARYEKNKGRFAHLGSPDNILKGMVFCADCNRTLMRLKMVYQNKKTAVWYYECRRFRVQNACKRKFYREQELNMAVYEALRTQLILCADIKGVVHKLNKSASHKSRLASYDLEIEEAKLELKRLSLLRQSIYEDYSNKILTLSEYQYAVEKYGKSEAIQTSRMESASLEKTAYTQSSTPENKWLAQWSRFIDAKELSVEMVKSLIKRIEIKDDYSIDVIFLHKDEYEDLREVIDEYVTERGAAL